MKVNAKMMGVYILSLLVMCLWGMSLIWTDQLKPFNIPPEYFLTGRILLAGLLLLVFNLLMGHSIRIRNRKDFRLFLMLSLFEPLVYFLAETYGLFMVDSPSVSALILGLNPVFALFFGIVFFHEKVSTINIVGLLLTICGLAFVVIQGATLSNNTILGILILLIAVIAEVSYASLTKRLASGGMEKESVKDSYAPSVIVMYQFLIGALFMLPMILVRYYNPTLLAEDPLVPYMVTFDPDVYFSWGVLRPLLCLVVICSCLCFSIWAFCIKHLGVAKSGNFIAITPIFTALLCWILGRAPLTAIQWLGLAIAILGLILTQYTGGLSLRRVRLRIRMLR